MNDLLPRDFKGIWIPRALWLDDALTPLQKMLIAEIDSLSTRERGCSASNAYLASFFGVSENRMAHMVSDLRKAGWVKTDSFNGRSRVLKLNNPALLETNNPALLDFDIPYIRENKEENKGEDGVDLLAETEKKGRDKFQFSTLIPSELKRVVTFATAWSDFVADRKERRKPLTERSAAMILKRLDEQPDRACEALAMCIERGWSSFQWSWLDSWKRVPGSNKPTVTPPPLLDIVKQRELRKAKERAQ